MACEKIFPYSGGENPYAFVCFCVKKATLDARSSMETVNFVAETKRLKWWRK